MKNHSVLLASSIILGSALLLPWLSTIPGLHGDEAAYGIEADAILHHNIGTVGISRYTGSLYPLLEAAFIGTMGPTVEALRLLTVVTTLTSVALYHRVVVHLLGRKLADVAVLTLISLPFFALFGRIATEASALNPLLALLAIATLQKVREGPKRDVWAYSIVAGLFLGLGVWNHIIFITIPIALLGMELFSRGLAGLYKRRLSLFAVCVGMLIALAPRLLFQSSPPTGTILAVATVPSLPLPNVILHRLITWPVLLIQLSHGDLLFQRFAGIVLFHSPNIAAAVLLAGMGIILMTASNRQSVRTCPEALLLMFGVTLFLATVVICPRTADRYFHLLLYLVPIIMAFAFQTLFERIGSRLSVIAFCLFLGIQLARTGINYFASLHTYGGLTSVFALDNTLETSNHLIRTDILYKELTGLHITTIMAEYFIALPLRFYDLRNHTFRSVIVTDHDVTHLLDEGALLPQEEPCIVMYADGLRRLTSEEVPNLKEISSDQHFIVGFYKPLDRHP